MNSVKISLGIYFANLAKKNGGLMKINLKCKIKTQLVKLAVFVN